jgi:divalent metal cation (Fe/Co/Zn/Cd) transporter
VLEGHGIAAEVKKQIIEQIEDVVDVLIHVNPCSQNREW